MNTLFDPDVNLRPQPAPTADTTADTGGWADLLTGALGNPYAWLITLGALILAILTLSMIFRRLRKTRLATAARTIAGPLVLAWEAQGVYGIGRDIGLAPAPSAVGATVTAFVLIYLGAKAHEHHKRHGTLGPAFRLMWCVAIPMGVVVAANAHIAAEAGLRIILPVMAGIVFVAEYLPDEPPNAERKRKLGGFRYTPRRIAVELGLFEATEADIDTINRQRLIDQMTRLEFKRRQTGRVAKMLADRRAYRLDRLTLKADDEIIAAVAQNVTRTGWYQKVEKGDTPWMTAAERAALLDQAATAEAEAEAARKAEAEARQWAEAEAAARKEAETEAVRIRAEAEQEANLRKQAEAEAAQVIQRADGSREALRAQAEAAVAQARMAAEAETRRREAAEAEVSNFRFRAEEEARKRQEAEAQAERFRQEAEAARTSGPRPQVRRRASGSTGSGSALAFDGVPVPAVLGVSAETVLRVLAARRDNPDATQKELAATVGVSDRTVRTVLTAVPDVSAGREQSA